MEYGKVEFRAEGKAGLWSIECAPQVKIKLKRAFPRVNQAAAVSIDLMATSENSRDLEWFLERYPMTMSAYDRALLATRAEKHKQQEEKVTALLGNRIDLPTVPMAEPARDYQLFAAEMLATRGGQLLADQVGTGKTVTAIASIVRGENLPALVVCPAHLPSHWKKFLKRFAPDLNVHVVKRGKPYALSLSKQVENSLFPEMDFPQVIVCSYHKLRGWAESLAGQVKLVVFEECQQLRRNDSDIYRACKHVAESATKRLGASATPIFNYGGEFFNILDCLFPEEFGSMAEFDREWCSGYYGKQKLDDPEAFGAYLRSEGMMLLRTRKDIGREIPAVQTVVHEVESDPEALRAVTGDAMALARIILADSEVHRGDKMQAAGELDAMIRQATGVAKAPYVAEFVRLLLESGEKVVLFGWHRAVYGIWLEKLADFKPAMYTGSESPTQKDKAVEAFVKGDTDLLILSLRSGAGIDGLQFVCSTGVFGEFDWSPGVHTQCIGRYARDGQENPCMAYFLASNEGSDPIVIDILGLKKAQSDGVLDPDGASIIAVGNQTDHIKEVARRLLDKTLRHHKEDEE